MTTGKQISNNAVMALRAAGCLVYVFKGRMPRGSSAFLLDYHSVYRLA